MRFGWKWTALLVLIVIAGIVAAFLGGWTWDESLLQ